jgi:hypothetical protein
VFSIIATLHFPSPNLTPLYFSSRGLKKTLLYHERVKNVNELRDRIVTAAECVTNEMLPSTCPETEYRLDVCRATMVPY